MKKSTKLILDVCLAIGLAIAVTGCSTTGTPETPSAIPSFDFDGFWQTPGTSVMWINKHVFTLQNKEGKILQTGVFTHTNSQFVINFDVGEYATCDYTINSGTLNVTSRNNQWANGIWKKINNVTLNGNTSHPLVGYWEQKTDERITILHITPWGWGDEYVCDLEYKLTSKWEITYEENNFTQFTTKMGGNDFSVTLQSNYVFDGADLLVGNNRYVKK